MELKLALKVDDKDNVATILQTALNPVRRLKCATRKGTAR